MPPLIIVSILGNALRLETRDMIENDVVQSDVLSVFRIVYILLLPKINTMVITMVAFL